MKIKITLDNGQSANMELSEYENIPQFVDTIGKVKYLTIGDKFAIAVDKIVLIEKLD